MQSLFIGNLTNDHAMIILDKEITYLINKYIHFLSRDNHKNFSLLTGLGSRILSKIHLSNYYENNSFRIDLDKDIVMFFKLIESSDSLSPTYCNGLSGAAWLILYLNDLDFIKIKPDEFLEDIDLFIESKLDLFFDEENYDILHGGLGIGLYFLKRGRIDKVNEIINFLEKTSIDDKNGYKWLKKSDFLNKQSIFDLSLAHGQASILYFLGKCYRQNISKNSCKKMINKIILFYFKTIQDHTIIGSFWPNSITLEDYLTKRDGGIKSRLAWCYGDLSILHTIFLTSVWLKNNKLKTKVESLLLISIKRTKQTETLIENDFFCHGTSGIIFIYMNLFHLTGNKLFRKAAEHWGQSIIENIKSKKIIISPDKIGILEGLEGILLSLHSLKTLEAESWGECLFLK